MPQLHEKRKEGKGINAGFGQRKNRKTVAEYFEMESSFFLNNSAIIFSSSEDFKHGIEIFL